MNGIDVGSDVETFTRDRWEPGDRPWFEYHCFESDDSADAHLWRHSQQRVTVVRHDPTDHDCIADGTTLDYRLDEAAMPCLYVIRFEDGLEAGVFEDELLTDPAGYSRPAPPR